MDENRRVAGLLFAGGDTDGSKESLGAWRARDYHENAMNIRYLLGDASSMPVVTLPGLGFSSEVAKLNKLAAEVRANVHQIQNAIQAAIQPSLTAMVRAQEAFRPHQALISESFSTFKTGLKFSARFHRDWLAITGLGQPVSDAPPLMLGLGLILETGCAPYVRVARSVGELVARFHSESVQIAEMIRQLSTPWQDLLARLPSFALPPLSALEPFHRYLLARSWYLSPDAPMSMVCELDNLHAEDREAEMDDWLCRYFRARLDQIEVELIVAYPQHQPTLSDALTAHRAGTFTLSIPALLVIADAIGHEL